MKFVRAILVSGLALLLLQPVQAAPLATLTILEGEAVLLRGDAKLALVEGVRLQADDMIDIGAKGQLVRLEFADGLRLSLGPSTRALLAPRLPGERGRARLYLQHGWAKLNKDKSANSDKATDAVSVATPLFDATNLAGETVIAVDARTGQLFAEGGAPQIRTGKGQQTLKSGEFASVAADGKLAVTPRPSPEFLKQLPRAFRDTLPARLARFEGKDLTPKRLADLGYADAEPWLHGEPALRRAYLPRWQALAKQPEFRKQLVADIKLHPEWQNILFPPPPPSPASAIPGKTAPAAPPASTNRITWKEP